MISFYVKLILIISIGHHLLKENNKMKLIYVVLLVIIMNIKKKMKKFIVKKKLGMKENILQDIYINHCLKKSKLLF